VEERLVCVKEQWGQKEKEKEKEKRWDDESQIDPNNFRTQPRIANFGRENSVVEFSFLRT
jgi:hypothetical protein